MRTLPPIPDGWRLLGPDEPLSIGDKWFNTNFSGHYHEWRLEMGVDAKHVGSPSKIYGSKFKWITPIKVEVKDKEWLNPWD